MTSAGVAATPRMPAPLFVAQGQSDTLINPAITQAYADQQQQSGTQPTYLSLPDTGHGLVVLRAVPHLVTWLSKLT